MFAELCILYTTLPTVISFRPSSPSLPMQGGFVFVGIYIMHTHLWTTPLRAVETRSLLVARDSRSMSTPRNCRFGPVLDAKKSTTTKNDKVLRFTACQRQVPWFIFTAARTNRCCWELCRSPSTISLPLNAEQHFTAFEDLSDLIKEHIFWSWPDS